MSVQDDGRERELCRLFNLNWDSKHKRHGTDAFFSLEFGGKTVQIDVEVKSTTTDSVGTARDVGMDHIQKWRRQFWIVGFYTKEKAPDLIKTLCLTPDDMEPSIVEIENSILPDFKLAGHAASRLILEDLYAVCGEKEFYTLADAKRLHKKQWSNEQYSAALELNEDGKKIITRERMLSILNLRSKYIAERGATLNNPKLNKSFLSGFNGTNREINENWASNLRKIAEEYLLEREQHPFKVL